MALHSCLIDSNILLRAALRDKSGARIGSLRAYKTDLR